MKESASSVEPRLKGLWAVILGGSSGFGLATAKRLARAGMNVAIGHKDRPGIVDTELKPHFDEIRKAGVELFTQNGNLMEDEQRGSLLEQIEKLAGRGKVHLFMHSIAAGSCKPAVDGAAGPDVRKANLKGLAEALHAEGVRVS